MIQERIPCFARYGGFLLGATLLGLVLLTAPVRADENARKPRYPKPPSDKNVALTPDAWKSVPVRKLAPAELDRVLAASQKADKVKVAESIDDGGFLRRVHLDLVGRLPGPKDVRAFLSSDRSDKRARLIDGLLASDDFARHRARYWRDVILARATDNRGPLKFPREMALEEWLFERFKDNASWGATARALITSTSTLSLRESKQGGDAGMLLCHTRDDGPVERTNDTVRVFLGINLQCAQCHDHPDDIWKRRQFHEMAAFYGKLTERFRFERAAMEQPSKAGKPAQPMIRNVLISLAPRPFGDYRMPDRDDPKKFSPVQPRFLTGESPGRSLNDIARRKALAGYVTAKSNYYFSAAFVNRVWGELLGQAFVMPVENLGPLQPALYSDVLLRLAASFRASDFDVKALYRLILNSQAYQRRMRLGDSPSDHVKFAGTYPTRLRAEALWNALLGALEIKEPPMPADKGPFAQRFRAGVMFREMFSFDPSTRPEDVEGSVPQSLLLMNNTKINSQIKATGNTMLARVLRDFPKDGDAINQVYLRALGRNPTPREKRVCLEHIAELGKRGPAFEDILWALINSAEFRTKR
jgi:hypothetical protein